MINSSCCRSCRLTNSFTNVIGRVELRALCVVTAFVGICATVRSAEVPLTRPPSTAGPLARILSIDWETGPNLPQGFQDSDGGIIHHQLITVGGFCSGGLNEDNQRKPGRYPRGFLQKVWALDLLKPRGTWRELPEFPGAARQGVSAAVVEDKLFVWGGFSYTEPYCYSDGWKLTRNDDSWRWSPVASFPWPINSMALSTIDGKIYAFGGSDYNAEAFFTDSDRKGERERLGARLLVLDTTQADAQWRELPACPGTPRWVHTMSAQDGDLYVIGGATGNTVRDGRSYGYCTVVDNWKFDTQNEIWLRLADSPIASGNFPRSTSNVFRNRYIILPGGHQYSWVLNPDGSTRPSWGQANSANPKSGLHNDVFVYDIRTDRFGTADRLPIDNNLPMTVVREDRIYLIGGETGGGVVGGEYYGHHPDLLLIGRIAVPNSAD